MIAEEETNKETITARITDQIIDRTMVLNKETNVQTTGPTIDPITVLDLTMVPIIDRITGRIIDLVTDRDQTMDQDLIMVPITDRATDHRIQAQIN